MKTKRLIIIPALAMVLGGCAKDTPRPLNEKESFKSDTTSNDSFYHASPIDEDSRVSSEDIIGSSIGDTLLSDVTDLNGIRELRNPSALSHDISYSQYTAESFINFKKKMQYFSNKLTDICVSKYSKYNSNFVISPLSIEMCLGLAIRAAEGDTRDEILEAFDMDYETFNTNYKLFYNYLESTMKNYSGGIISQLLLANSIWIDDSIELKVAGLDALRDDYYCYSYGVDCDGKNAEANEAMREFVYQNTKGKINPRMDLSPDTLFVLVNTLYSKGLWYEDGSDLRSAPITYKFTNQDGT